MLLAFIHITWKSQIMSTNRSKNLSVKETRHRSKVLSELRGPHYPAHMFHYTSLISPQAILAPALPVILLTNPSCGGPGSLALELSPKPRSSSLAWIIMERPTTEPNFSCSNNFTWWSVMLPLECPSASAVMLPSPPTCRISSSGAPWSKFKGFQCGPADLQPLEKSAFSCTWKPCLEPGSPRFLMSQVIVMLSALGCSRVTTPVQGFSGSVPSQDLPLGPTTLVAFNGKELMVWLFLESCFGLSMSLSVLCSACLLTREGLD